MKGELQKLEELLRDLGNLYKWDMVVTASVIVQNMAFNADKFKEKEFIPYLSILKKMKDYNESNHILQWAYDEASMIVEAHFYSLYLDESDLNAFENQSTEQ
jgi:hypothetical protein